MLRAVIKLRKGESLIYAVDAAHPHQKNDCLGQLCQQFIMSIFLFIVRQQPLVGVVIMAINHDWTAKTNTGLSLRNLGSESCVKQNPMWSYLSFKLAKFR